MVCSGLWFEHQILDLSFLHRNWETIWRSARTMKPCSKSSPTPQLWLSASQPRPHKGESTDFCRVDFLLIFLYHLFTFSRSHPLEMIAIYILKHIDLVYFCGFRSQLSDDELKQLEEACDMALELNQSKHRIYEYVESRMSFIAPNLSIIVGASTAAKIMG